MRKYYLLLGDIQAPMWIHFYDIRTISPKTYVPGIRKKTMLLKIR